MFLDKREKERAPALVANRNYSEFPCDHRSAIILFPSSTTTTPECVSRLLLTCFICSCCCHRLLVSAISSRSQQSFSILFILCISPFGGSRELSNSAVGARIYFYIPHPRASAKWSSDCKNPLKPRAYLI